MKKVFELRQESAKDAMRFETSDWTASNVRSLTDDRLNALIMSGVVNWGYRAGAKKENDGKVFSLEQIADAIMAGGTRDGEPTEKDIEMAKSIVGPLVLAARKAYPLAENASAEDTATCQSARDTHVYAALSEKIERNAKAQGYEAVERSNDDESFEQWAARWFRFHRLFVAKKAKKLD